MAKDIYDGTEAPPLTTPLEIESCSRVVKIKLTPEVINGWEIPYWQRTVRYNTKVREIVEGLRKDPKLDSMLIVGVLKKRGKYHLFLVDGHHRKDAFNRSGVPYLNIDVKFVYVETMGEMAELYLRCQGQISRSTADNNLKGVAVTHKQIADINSECGCITYDGVRLGTSTASVSMSTVVQIWYDSMLDPPKKNSGSPSKTITELASNLTTRDAEKIVEFILLCKERFGFSELSCGLWKHINLTLCLWLYRIMVWREGWAEGEDYSRVTVLTPKQFGTGLSGLVNGRFYQTLNHKSLSSVADRKETFRSIVRLFSSNLTTYNVVKTPKLPKPPWAAK
jgi:hypothetical protein